MEKKVIYIPSELMPYALDYIERNSSITWMSGTKPTRFCPRGKMEALYLGEYLNRPVITHMADPYHKSTFNELADFTKGVS